MLIADRERAAGAVEFISAALVVLAGLEVGQHVLIGPAGAAQRGPVVIVPGVAADIEHGVDRARPAQSASARLIAPAPVQALHRLGFERPVRALGQGDQHAGGLDPEIVVGAARFQQADPARGVFAQPARHGAARAATADHDNVELVHPASPLHRCQQRMFKRAVKAMQTYSAGTASCRSCQRARIESEVSRLPSWLQPGGANM